MSSTTFFFYLPEIVLNHTAKKLARVEAVETRSKTLLRTKRHEEGFYTAKSPIHNVFPFTQYLLFSESLPSPHIKNKCKHIGLICLPESAVQKRTNNGLVHKRELFKGRNKN